MSDALKIPEMGEYVRFIGRLVDIVPERPQPPPKKDYILEEVGADIELRFNGERLKGLGSYSDFYGLETSVETAIKEAKEYAERKGIGKDSELEVVVVKEVRRYRARPTNQAIVWTGYRDYAMFQPVDYPDYGMPEPVRTEVWSSKNE